MYQLLMYNMESPDKSRKIKAIATRMKLRFRVVEPEEFSLPLGRLAEIPGGEAMPEGDGTPFGEEMLVLCNVPGAAFQNFLAQLRAQKVPVTLKAALTEYNISWSSTKLYREIAAEHQAMLEGKWNIHRQDSSGNKE